MEDFLAEILLFISLFLYLFLKLIKLKDYKEITTHKKFLFGLIPLDLRWCHSWLILLAITWDEAPMMSKYAVEYVDRMLRELSEHPTLLFGGRLIVFGGDFKKTLPVGPREGRGGITSKIFLKNVFFVASSNAESYHQ